MDTVVPLLSSCHGATLGNRRLWVENGVVLCLWVGQELACVGRSGLGAVVVIPSCHPPSRARKCLWAMATECQKDSRQLQDKQWPLPSGAREAVG